jgi:hypothetical protein
MSGHQATNFPRPHISQPVGEGREAGLPGGGEQAGASDSPLPRCRECGQERGHDALQSGLCASCRRDRLDEERYSQLEDEMDRSGVDDGY